MSSLKQSPPWTALQQHYEEMKDVHMRELFKADPDRFNKYSLTLGTLLFDYSKNRINQNTIDALIELARQSHVEEWRDKMFAGDAINHTEGRAVQHTALRADTSKPLYVTGADVSGEIDHELSRVKDMAEKIRTRAWRGATNQPITDVVNIGIGGSHLGPQMVTEALTPYTIHDLAIHFVNNIDENHITNTLEKLNPDTTLFIISSKSFTTQDTMVNADTARKWLLHKFESAENLHRHLVAVTANPDAAEQFGVDPVNILKMWDWVGGRYSLWSAIGLSIVIAIGSEHFEDLLAGARAADEHFKNTSLENNIPVIMAMLGVWYNNFFEAETIAILPYDQNMHRFPAYLQQADMESNGKSVDRAGECVDYSTGPVLFGEIGIASQHAFYQLLHQGTKLVPADMLAPVSNFQCIAEHHRALMSNVFAQSEAMMLGKTADEAMTELLSTGMDKKEAEALLPYKLFPGNRPTNTFLFHTLDPKTLGTIIALYEHKIFVQGIVWNLNSFDQWGVELGKVLAKNILEEINDGKASKVHDSSTQGLMNYYFKLRSRKG